MNKVDYNTFDNVLITDNIHVLSSKLSVRDGYGRGRHEFAGRVQKYHVRFTVFLENKIVKAAALLVHGRDTLGCWLREGCHCRRLPSHYRRARTQD